MARQRNLITTISEFFRIKDKVQEENPISMRSRKMLANYYNDNNPRRIRMNYGLTSAVYNAQKYDEYYNFTLAPYGKPIVNAATSFIIGALPSVKLLPSENQTLLLNRTGSRDLKYGEERVNKWIKKHEWKLYKLVRDTMKDADCYINVEDPNNPEILKGSEVTKLYNNFTGKLSGYVVTREIVQEDESDTNNVATYKYTYRTTSPFKTIEYKDNNTTDYVTIYEENGDADIFEQRRLPIVGWHNDLEEDRLYGNSEYRNILYLLIKYTETFDNAMVNNATASRPIPFVKGVANVDEFAKNYGTQDEEDGSYEISLDGNQIIVDPGQDFGIGNAQVQDVTSGAMNIQEKLFYAICQGSETPEFVMGAAVNSSQASVETQMPVIVKKAVRKQKEFGQFLQDTLEAVAEYLKIDPRFPLDYELDVTWGKIVDEDNKITIEIADKLLQNGCITKATYAKIINANIYVDDINKEIQLAEKEAEARRQQAQEENPDNQNNNDGNGGGNQQ